MTQSNRPQTYDHLKSKKKPTTRSVTISLDDDLQEAYELAKENFDAARAEAELLEDEASKKKLRAATKALDEARAAAEEATAIFKFRSIGRKKYDALVDQNPPSEEQRKEIADAGGDPDNLAWNTDTFPKALVAASIIEPELSPEAIDEMWDSDIWSESELSALSMAALEANNSRRIVELGKG